MEPRPPKILILGGDADGNLGDRAILQSTCREFKTARPDVELTVVTDDSEVAEREYGARAVPGGLRGFPRLCAAAMDSHVVLCGGGGLFQDDDSLIKMPYWGLRVALMRLLCRRVVGYSLGVGPLQAASSRAFARLAFACMETVTVRDPRAQRVARELTDKPVRVLPDPALLSEPSSPEQARRLMERRGIPLDGPLLLGVAPRRWFPPKARVLPHRLAWALDRTDPAEEAGSRRLTDSIAAVLDRMVDGHGAYVVFLPTYNVGHEGDARLCEEILKKMSSPRGEILHVDSPGLYQAVVRELRAVLAGRMHAAILSATVGTPVVSIAYNPKFHGLAELLECGGVLDAQELVSAGGVDQATGLLEAVFNSGVAPRERAAELGEWTRKFTVSLVEGLV